MNQLQRAKLQALCERYGVTFNESDYLVYPAGSFTMPEWAEGWIGGQPGTLYVGVSPEGESHS